MTPTDDLFQLVKSLSKAEKRYFKIYALKEGGDKSYLKLFDAIDALDSYDEQVFKKKHQKASFVKHLSAAKKYLFNAIIDCLKNHSEYETVEHILKNLMEKIYFLDNKGLNEICLVYIQNAKAIARANERFIELIKLNEKERVIVQRIGGDISKELCQLDKEYDELKTHYSNFMEYEILYRNFFRLLPSNAKNSDQVLTNIINEKYLKNIDMALSNKAKDRWYQIHSLMASIRGDAQLMYKYKKELLDNFKLLHQSNMNEVVKEYATLLNNFIIACIHTKQYNEAEKRITELNALLEKKIPHESKILILSFYYFLSLFYACKVGKFDSVTGIVEDMLLNNFLRKKSIKQQTRESLYVLLFRYFFSLQNFKEANSQLKYLLDKKDLVIKYYHPLGRLFQIMAFYELEDMEYVSSLAENARKYFSRNIYPVKIEEAIIKALLKAIKITDKKEKLNVFISLKENLVSLSREQSEMIKFEFFDFISWVDSKINRKPMIEAIKAQAI